MFDNEKDSFSMFGTDMNRIENYRKHTSDRGWPDKAGGEIGNRKLLIGAGSISHDQAMKKAKDEYRRYQAITLSPVEEEYLKSIKGVEKEVKKKSRR